jgi:serine phosphatase RsbU (regulator of sigma subunit)
MGTAAEVIELKRLTLDSPATQQLNEIQVEMIVPFFSQGELIGWLGLGPRRNGHGYSSHAKELMKKLATQIGPAIQVAQLLRQRKAEARRRERLTQEMQVARIIQQTLLPRHLPDLPGCQIAAHYRPVRAVGGDFYDFMFLPDGRVGFVIGDVSDTGIPAALLMATTRAILRTVTSQQTSPGEVLARANDLVFHDIPPKMFVTCICAIFEPSTGYLRYANAGHNPPYCRSAGGIEGLTAQGVPLGLMPEVSYEEKEATIAVGDQLIFYSDGLTQARNAQGANFGSQRLYDLLADQSNSADKSIEPAEAFIDFLLDEWSRFTGSDWQQEDDMTLVIIEHVETKNFVARPDAETASPQAQFDKYR